MVRFFFVVLVNFFTEQGYSVPIPMVKGMIHLKKNLKSLNQLESALVSVMEFWKRSFVLKFQICITYKRDVQHVWPSIH